MWCADDRLVAKTGNEFSPSEKAGAAERSQKSSPPEGAAQLPAEMVTARRGKDREHHHKVTSGISQRPFVGVGCNVQSHASVVLPAADPQVPPPAHHSAHIPPAALVLLFPFSPQVSQGDLHLLVLLLTLLLALMCFYCLGQPLHLSPFLVPRKEPHPNARGQAVIINVHREAFGRLCSGLVHTPGTSLLAKGSY